MKTQKYFSLILSIGVLVALTISIIYLFKSYSSLKIDDKNFIFNTSILFSNITSLVILIYLLRKTYFKNKKHPVLLFSKYSLFGLLIYLTLPLEIIVYSLYKYKMINFSFEKLTSLFFGIACVIITIYMIKGKDLNNSVK